MKKRSPFPIPSLGKPGSARRKASVKWMAGQLIDDIMDSLEWKPSDPPPPPSLGTDAWTGTAIQDGGLIVVSVIKKDDMLCGIYAEAGLNDADRIDQLPHATLSQEAIHRAYRAIDRVRKKGLVAE